MAVKPGKTHYFIICSEPDVAKATYVTRLFAEEAGFNSVMRTKIATAVSELAMNIVRYAGRGSVTVGLITRMGQPGIEIVAEDHGPGISNPVAAMTDHYSSGKSLGLGLPSVKRLMDEFLMDTSEDLGTKIVTRKWRN